jgi:hypothetical protein
MLIRIPVSPYVVANQLCCCLIRHFLVRLCIIIINASQTIVNIEVQNCLLGFTVV